MEFKYRERILAIKKSVLVLQAMADNLENGETKTKAKFMADSVLWAADELTKAQQIQIDLMGVIESQKQTADALIKKLKQTEHRNDR